MPISDCEVRDPRIRRTRGLLQAALQKLLQEKSFDDISVQDITDAATVNRATFYDHYSDKFTLLEAMVAGGFHRMLENRKVRYDGSCASAAGPVILATCDYLAECHAESKTCHRPSAVESLIEAAMTRAICRVLIDGISRSAAARELPPAMVASAASWAIFGAVKEWFGTAGRPAAEEAVPVILRLVLPILTAAGPPPDAAGAPLELSGTAPAPR